MGSVSLREVAEPELPMSVWWLWGVGGTLAQSRAGFGRDVPGRRFPKAV